MILLPQLVHNQMLVSRYDSYHVEPVSCKWHLKESTCCCLKEVTCMQHIFKHLHIIAWASLSWSMKGLEDPHNPQALGGLPWTLNPCSTTAFNFKILKDWGSNWQGWGRWGRGGGHEQLGKLHMYLAQAWWAPSKSHAPGRTRHLRKTFCHGDVWQRCRPCLAEMEFWVLCILHWASNWQESHTEVSSSSWWTWSSMGELQPGTKEMQTQRLPQPTPRICTPSTFPNKTWRLEWVWKEAYGRRLVSKHAWVWWNEEERSSEFALQISHDRKY